MESVSDMLGIDKVNMGGKIILIEERHDINASFLLNSIIFDALKKNYGICFVLFHNTFNHYHNVSMKFGYNLTILREEGKVKIVEPMKVIATIMQCIDGNTTNKLNVPVTKPSFDNKDNIILNLLTVIKNAYLEMTKHDNPVIIVIDDLSHLYNLGFSLKDTMYYVRYLRSLVEFNNVSQLCLVIHTYERELHSCILNTFVHSLKHMAHLFVMVEPFETGYSSDASGKITVNWRIDNIRRKYNWSEIVRYIYKLSDRQVKIYTPGTLAMLV
ncbi:elongator complex protein 6 [Hylaeus anthracinus]|uniref:elongator complex protein 6 n=1 Tax=Hylaeus volcanicus TaxID=313075 RepID=UPI0023B85F98|nr:elongator complex protein 6 [Hylaeus volcanicus]XP_054006166.1 elongator complex protein 6 [Hylaeus anthracinus]